MADGFVQAPPDAGGKKVDSTEQTNTLGATVERLRIAVPDGVIVSGDILDLILSEIQMTNTMLSQAFGIADQLERLRAQETT